MRVKSIKKVKPRKVYAITTSTATFIADGLAHHNCSGCNNYKHGNLAEYALYLTRKHGVNVLEDLQARASMQKARPKKYTLDELQAIIDEYGVKNQEK